MYVCIVSYKSEYYNAPWCIYEMVDMAERKNYDPGLVKVGELLSNKRKSLGLEYRSREQFISLRSNELFGGEDWVSPRHLANLELGKNWISIEKLVKLAAALEEDPVDLFSDILDTYNRFKL